MAAQPGRVPEPDHARIYEETMRALDELHDQPEVPQESPVVLPVSPKLYVPYRGVYLLAKLERSLAEGAEIDLRTAHPFDLPEITVAAHGVVRTAFHTHRARQRVSAEAFHWTDASERKVRQHIDQFFKEHPVDPHNQSEIRRNRIREYLTTHIEVARLWSPRYPEIQEAFSLHAETQRQRIGIASSALSLLIASYGRRVEDLSYTMNDDADPELTPDEAEGAMIEPKHSSE